MKIQVSVSTARVLSTVAKVIEIDHPLWDELTEDEQSDYIEECVNEAALQMIHLDWKKVEATKEPKGS